MRVISGIARGRKLKEPKGDSIRPTSDRVKESIFNIVQFDIEGRRVLDLFAGTGQFGIEAISRGAMYVVFNDNNPEAVKLIKDNLNICSFSDQAAVQSRDAIRALENDDKYDLIFIDPPYDTQLAARALDKIVEFDKLNINGIIICETKAGSDALSVPPPYEVKKRYKYGSVMITRIERNASAPISRNKKI